MFNGAPNTAGSGKRIEVPEVEGKNIDSLQLIHAPEPEAGAMNVGKVSWDQSITSVLSSTGHMAAFSLRRR